MAFTRVKEYSLDNHTEDMDSEAFVYPSRNVSPPIPKSVVPKPPIPFADIDLDAMPQTVKVFVNLGSGMQQYVLDDIKFGWKVHTKFLQKYTFNVFEKNASQQDKMRQIKGQQVYLDTAGFSGPLAHQLAEICVPKVVLFKGPTYNPTKLFMTHEEIGDVVYNVLSLHQNAYYKEDRKGLWFYPAVNLQPSKDVSEKFSIERFYEFKQAILRDITRETDKLKLAIAAESNKRKEIKLAIWEKIHALVLNYYAVNIAENKYLFSYPIKSLMDSVLPKTNAEELKITKAFFAGVFSKSSHTLYDDLIKAETVFMLKHSMEFTNTMIEFPEKKDQIEMEDDLDRIRQKIRQEVTDSKQKFLASHPSYRRKSI